MLKVVEDFVRRLSLEHPEATGAMSFVPILLASPYSQTLLPLATAVGEGRIDVASCDVPSALDLTNRGDRPVLCLAGDPLPAEPAGEVVLTTPDLIQPSETRRCRIARESFRSVEEVSDSGTPIFVRHPAGAPAIAIASFRTPSTPGGTPIDPSILEAIAAAEREEEPAHLDDTREKKEHSPAPRIHESQCGQAVFVHGFFAGADCVAVPEIFSSARERLTKGRRIYDLAMNLERRQQPERPLAVIRGVFNRLRYAEVRTLESRGQVRFYDFDTEEVSGRVMTYGEDVVTLTITPMFLIG